MQYAFILAKLFRLKHWSKQAFVFLGFLFTQGWETYFYSACLAAVAFSLAASSVYIYNDIEDLTRDKAHPHKRFRPLASGEISIKVAYGYIFLLNALALLLCYFLSPKAVLVIALYLLINVFYSNGLKHYPFVDVMCIGSGFMLRILMGTWAIGIVPSEWILVCGTTLSFFLAFSKRKLEWKREPHQQFLARPVLRSYTVTMLNVLLTISSIAFLGTYIAYAYQMSYVHEPKLHLMMTLPFVLFGFFRYLFLMSKTQKTDCPVSLFLSDKMSLLNLFILLCLSMSVLHHL